MTTTDNPRSAERFLHMDDVLQMVGGWARSTLWREIKQGRFPEPIPTTTQRVAWLESEVRAWQAERIAQRDSRRNRPMGPAAKKAAAAARAEASA